MSAISKICLKLQSINCISNSLRLRLLSWGGYKIGKNVVIRSNNYFTGDYIKIGNNCFINNFCKFYSHWNNKARIEIENDCTLAMGVTLCTHTHEIGDPEHRASQISVFSPIRIGSGSWIGANVLVLPGVIVGRGCIIAAGAVVVDDCEENGLYAGVPARLIRKLN